MCGDIHSGKVASETTAFGPLCPDMPCYAQTCLDLPGSLWVALGALSDWK